MFQDKFKASAIHFLLSFTLVSLLLCVIIYFWFPLDYLSITNFKDIALLIILIDLMMGPILTFIVFKKGKKNLRFDLITIAVIQVSALIYGINALFQTHPLFFTYKNDSFYVVQANEVDLSKAKHKEYKISKLETGKLAFTKMPTDLDEQAAIMAGVDLKGEPDIDKRVEYYEPVNEHISEILAKKLDPDKIFQKNNLNKDAKSFLATNKNNIDRYAFFPLKGVTKDAILVLDINTMLPITTINSNPLHYTKK